MATYYVRVDGNDANSGTGSGANQAWQTITKAIGSTGVAPGDTLYIAPGVYRGTFTAGFTNPANSGQRIIIQGDPTASQFTGVSPNPVILTNYLLNNSTPTSGVTLNCVKDYVTFNNLVLQGYTAGGAPLYGRFLNFQGVGHIFNYCHFQGNPAFDAYAFQIQVTGGGQGPIIQNCAFFTTFEVVGLATATAWNSNTSIKDSLIVHASNGNNQAGGIKLNSITSGSFGGVTVSNCTIITAGTGITATSLSTSFPSLVTNSNIYGALVGISASSNNGQITQTYNSITGISTLTNVATSATSVTFPMTIYELGYSRSLGFANYPLFANMPNTYGISAGISTNAPASDFYGVTWITPSTPTIGAIETSSYTSTGQYNPTERNASTITIAPGSTSQSIELFLGVTGLTASTSGLTARYNRTRTASVSIPLVARTIAQAWTSGGFAEVDATNMPGVYRLDVPDTALAAGADDVTIVVRGASGTNGAVMTVKLSSGGLTSAQTASAVFNALTADYTTHGTFGYNLLRADQDSKEGLVTLHQSGGVSRVDADIHAIANDTDAATELKGALLHNGTDYISADLLTPVSAATSVHIGPYQLMADGLGADQPLDVNVGTATSIDVQVTDANGTGIDITGATTSAKVYNAGGTLVATYSGTATYADNGRLSFGLTTTVTNTSGTYTVTVTRTTGATDTQVFGPLKLYVRPV
jgi:hypothetical protein